MMIQQALIIVLMVIAVWCCMLDGMIFGKVRHFYVPEWVKSPLYDCPVCMVPYYGTILYWLNFHVGVYDWIFTIIVAMGMATIFVKFKRN